MLRVIFSFLLLVGLAAPVMLFLLGAFAVQAVSTFLLNKPRENAPA